MTRRGWKRMEEVTGARSYNNFSYVPEELVFNILPRLPVDSALRFRCVSKQWLSLISQIKLERQKLIIRSGLSEKHSSFQSIVETTRLKNLELPWKSNSVHIYSSCHGILLIRRSNDLYLWNPNIGWYKKIFSNHNLCYGGANYAWRLCFDSYDKEYKISLRSRSSLVVGGCKSKSWTRIHFPYRGYAIHKGPILNNILHWLGSGRSVKPCVVIYFDPRTDEVGKIPTAIPEEGKTNSILGLGVLHECLCMTRQAEIGIIELLKMKEYGVGESWSLLFKIKELYGACKVVPLFYTDEREGEVLMKVKVHHLYTLPEKKIVKYDASGKFQTITTLPKYKSNAVVYEETSVIPIRYIREDIESEGKAASKEHVWDSRSYGDYSCWGAYKFEWEERYNDFDDLDYLGISMIKKYRYMNLMGMMRLT